MLEKITRRGFISKLFAGAVGVGIFGTIAEIASQTRRPKKENENKRRVADFSDEICFAALRSSNYDIFDSYYGYFAFATLGYVLAHEHKEEIESCGKSASLMIPLAGSGCLVNRIVDTITTFNAFEILEDPRMEEYGLKKYFGEANIAYDFHARKEEFIGLKSFLISGASIIIGSMHYPAGMGITYSTLPIYSNNINAAEIMKKAIDIGDRVKTMIEQGKDKDIIREYLNNLNRR